SMQRLATKTLAPLVTLIVLMLVGSTLALAQTTITFGTRSSKTRDALAQAVINGFEKQHPDITVQFTPITGDYDDKIGTLFAGGSAPDVMEAWADMGITWAQRGFLLDLAPYVKRDAAELNVSDILPAAWSFPVMRVGPLAGMRFGVPRYLNVVIFYNNRDLFDNAGLPYPSVSDKNGSWDWDTLVRDGQKLTITGPDGKITQWGLKTNDSISRGAAWAWSAGGDVFDPANPLHFVLNQGGGLEGMQFLSDLRWKYGIWLDHAPSFDGGHVAMDNTKATDGLSDMIGSIGKSFNWDVSQVPLGPAKRGTRTSSDMYVVNKNAKNPDAAWEFVKYLLSPEGQMLSAKIAGMVPVRASLYGPYVALNSNKNLAAFFNGANNAQVDPTATILDSSAVTPMINDAMDANLSKHAKSMKQALDGAAVQIEAYYKAHYPDLLN
ncbi:MAG TPA: extracellular solute-binding protein, partial [Limnochordia bacterium]|nr:extracellular solute-binding protein [Limnochordia bacterium]